MKKTMLLVVLLSVLPLVCGSMTLRGDVDSDSKVSIDDVTGMIDYLLSSEGTSIDMDNADVNGDNTVDINDVTALIDYLLWGKWPAYVPRTETFTVNGVTFTMVIVEGGTFDMGATAEQEGGYPYPEDNEYVSEYPVHQVTLSTFSLGQTEVTQELWEAVMIPWVNNEDTVLYEELKEYRNPSYFSVKNGYAENLQRPVESVDTWMIDCFLYQLKRLTGREFRLPTEAEWEYAARGGNQSKGYKYAGSNDINEVAWYRTNAFFVGEDSPDYGTHAVGTMAPNELGLYDMSGNIEEKCCDMYVPYTSEPQTNPTFPHTDPNGPMVGRGGSWFIYNGGCRVSTRAHYPDMRSWRSGIRLAL